MMVAMTIWSLLGILSILFRMTRHLYFRKAQSRQDVIGKTDVSMVADTEPNIVPVLINDLLHPKLNYFDLATIIHRRTYRSRNT